MGSIKACAVIEGIYRWVWVERFVAGCSGRRGDVQRNVAGCGAGVGAFIRSLGAGCRSGRVGAGPWVEIHSGYGPGPGSAL